MQVITSRHSGRCWECGVRTRRTIVYGGKYGVFVHRKCQLWHSEADCPLNQQNQQNTTESEVN